MDRKNFLLVPNVNRVYVVLWEIREIYLGLRMFCYEGVVSTKDVPDWNANFRFCFSQYVDGHLLVVDVGRNTKNVYTLLKRDNTFSLLVI